MIPYEVNELPQYSLKDSVISCAVSAAGYNGSSTHGHKHRFSQV